MNILKSLLIVVLLARFLGSVLPFLLQIES